MATAKEFIVRSALLSEGAALTDGQLLDYFVSRREPAALEMLVRRLGPMVWGVCHRILQNQHDVEDAFQAAFLIFARKAPSINCRAKVAGWLYGVAYHTALKARTMKAKRKQRETQVINVPEPAARECGDLSDLLPLLDRELSRLPENYRDVVVLCELEGKSLKEAARELRVPQGTVASRLARARAILAKKLTRRGLAVSSAALAIAVSRNAAKASVPGSALSSTIKAVTQIGSGESVAGLISAKVAILTEITMKSLLLAKLQVAATVMLLLALTGFGASWLLLPTRADEPPKQAQAGDKPAAKPEKDRAVSDLVTKAANALGGRDKAARLREVKVKGKCYVREGDNVLDLDSEASIKNLDKVRVESSTTVDGAAHQSTMVMTEDKGWERSTMVKDVIDTPKDELAMMQSLLLAFLAPGNPSALLDRKDLTLAHGGEAKFRDTPVEVLRISRKDRPDVTIHFDLKTGLPVESETRFKQPNDGPEQLISLLFSDFKEEDGVKYYSRIKVLRDDKLMAEIEITELKPGAKIDASTFEKP